MKGRQFLKIAGLYYSIPLEVKLTPNYFPFVCQQDELVKRVTSTIELGEIKKNKKELIHQGLAFDSTKSLYIYKVSENEGRGFYITLKTQEKEDVYEFYASEKWSKVVFSRNCTSPDCPSVIIDLFLMLVCTYSAAFYNTVFIHASCVKLGVHGVAFIGQSGAGKSTHSQLWLDHIKGTNLLNDDQPAIRIHANGEVKIYGTPWSGKTPCYINDSALLRGIIRMVQAPINQLTELDPISLFQQLLASCSMIKTDPITFKLITSTLAELASSVSGFILENRPEKKAALMTYSTVLKKFI